MHNPKICMESCDIKESVRGCFCIIKEKCWDLMHYCMFMHKRMCLFYDGTNVYATCKKNDHYVHHNAATIVISNRCQDNNSSREC